MAHAPRAPLAISALAEIADPQERRLAIIRLHAQGWTSSTIARYLEVSRPTVHADLKRWVADGVWGLPDTSHANTSKGGTPLRTRNPIRTKQRENPLLGEYRMHGALNNWAFRSDHAPAAGSWPRIPSLWATHSTEGSARG